MISAFLLTGVLLAVVTLLRPEPRKTEVEVVGQSTCWREETAITPIAHGKFDWTEFREYSYEADHIQTADLKVAIGDIELIRMDPETVVYSHTRRDWLNAEIKGKWSVSQYVGEDNSGKPWSLTVTAIQVPSEAKLLEIPDSGKIRKVWCLEFEDPQTKQIQVEELGDEWGEEFFVSNRLTDGNVPRGLFMPKTPPSPEPQSLREGRYLA